MSTADLFQILDSLLGYYETYFPVAACLFGGYCLARIPDLVQAAINETSHDEPPLF